MIFQGRVYQGLKTLIHSTLKHRNTHVGGPDRNSMIYTFTLHLQMYMYTLTCTFVNAHGNYQLFIKPFFITCNSLIICNTGKPIKSDQCIQRSCDLWVIWARFCIHTNRGVKLYYHIKLSSPHFAFTPFLLNL